MMGTMIWCCFYGKMGSWFMSPRGNPQWNWIVNEHFQMQGICVGPTNFPNHTSSGRGNSWTGWDTGKDCIYFPTSIGFLGSTAVLVAKWGTCLSDLPSWNKKRDSKLPGTPCVPRRSCDVWRPWLTKHGQRLSRSPALQFQRKELSHNEARRKVTHLPPPWN